MKSSAKSKKIGAPIGNKRAVGNRGGAKGRSGAPKYKPEYAEQARLAYEAGGTDAEVASLFDVTVRTLIHWRLRYPDFSIIHKPAKEIADDRVVKSLYGRGVDGDVTACIFWLKNRRPTEWRDRRETEHDGNVTVTIRRVRAKVEGEE